MQVKGGFSGARLGGIQLYHNDTHGFSMYLPQDAQVNEPTSNYVAVVAPQPSSGGHPGGAFITIEPANGRTVEQVVEGVKTELGEGFNVTVDTAMGIDDAQALVVNGLPGQDVNRQLFMVHNDQVYNIVFAPANLDAGEPYRQMEGLYSMVVNTFHFTD